MRINYLVPGPMGRSPEGKAELARRGSLLRQYAAPGTEVGIDDVPEGPASIESMYEEYLSIPAAACRAVELEDNGWDALILGCYGDPGLDALRELLMIPIIGPGEATAPNQTLKAGPIELDLDAHLAYVAGVELPLTLQEFRLLTYLVQGKGRVRTRDELLADVWNASPELETRTVDTHVKRLRDKLGAAGSYIETIRGVGYRFQLQPDA